MKRNNFTVKNILPPEMVWPDFFFENSKQTNFQDSYSYIY